MAEINLEIQADIKEALAAIEKFSKAGQDAFKDVEQAQKKSRVNFAKFGKSLKGAFKTVTDSIFSVKGALIGLGGILAGREIIGFINDVTDAAAVQEDAINQLNTALQLTGEFTEETSQELQAFAAEMQRTTVIGDETTLSMLALAKSFGASNDQAKDLVKAAADLSAATGITLESAIRNLGKTFGGLTGELGEVVPELRTLGKESLQAGGAIDFILKRFGGAAAAQVNTFSGATQQLSNTFGDLQERLGFIITENPEVITAIKAISSVFEDIIKVIKGNEGEISDFVSEIARSFVDAIPTAIKAIARLVKAIGSLIEFVEPVGKLLAIPFRIVGTAVAGLITNVETLVTALAVLVGKASLDDLKRGILASKAAYEDFGKTIIDEVGGVFRGEFLESSNVVQGTVDTINELAEGITEVGVRSEKTIKKVRAEAEKGINARIDVSGLDDALEFDVSKIKIGDAISNEFVKLAKFFGDELGKSISTIIGTSLAQGGKAGAEALVKGITTEGGAAAADALIGPGAGEALKPVLGPLSDALLQGPDAVRQNVREFAKALPEVLAAFREAIPVFIEELANQSDEIIVALARNSPAVAKALILAMPRVAEALVLAVRDLFATLLADIRQSLREDFNFNLLTVLHEAFAEIQNFIASASTEAVIGAFAQLDQQLAQGALIIATSLDGAFVGIRDQLRELFTGFFSLVSQITIPVPPWIESFQETLKSFTETPEWLEPFEKIVDNLTSFSISSAAGGLSAGGGTGGVLGQTISAGASALGFHSGGEVPATGLALVEKGELVVPKQDFDQVVGSQQSAGNQEMLLAQIASLLSRPQEVATSINIDGQALANVILQLNQNNERLA